MHSNRRITQPSPADCRGFSLVELMVALVITLILLGGIGQIFLSSKKSFNIQDSLARMQESGRYAIEILVQDLRRAGYWGGNADIEKIVDHTQGGADAILAEDGTCTDSDWARKLDHKLFGKDDNRTGYGCLSGGTHVGDVLTVRYAAPWLVGGTTTDDFEDNMMYLRSSLFESALFLGVDEASYPVPRALRTAELIARAYYINPASPSATNCSGTVPSLNRVTLNRTTGNLTNEELALGIENLQFQYGLDTDDNNSVDNWVNAGDAELDDLSEWDQVIGIRLWLLIRAECPETGFANNRTYTMGNQNIVVNDGYRRQLYTTTVMLRNR